MPTSVHPVATDRTPAYPFPVPVQRVLVGATRAEILLLDLDRKGDYHGVTVRGRAMIEDEAARQLGQAILSADWWVESDECHDPQYGVRLEAGEDQVELLFCFPCNNVRVVGPREHDRIYPIAGGPERLLRRLLRQAGVLRPWWRFWG